VDDICSDYTIDQAFMQAFAPDASQGDCVTQRASDAPPVTSSTETVDELIVEICDPTTLSFVCDVIEGAAPGVRVIPPPICWYGDVDGDQLDSDHEAEVDDKLEDAQEQRAVVITSEFVTTP
jgi:hypothetical protein